MDQFQLEQRKVTATTQNNLQKLITSTYLKVAGAVFFTGIISFGTTYLLGDRVSQINGKLFAGGWILTFIMVIAAFVKIRSFVEKRENKKALLMFYTIAGVTGLTLTLPISYFSLNSIGGAFLISSAIFLGLAKFGTSTNKDFVSWGKTLFMLLIGSLVLSVIGMFFGLGTTNILLNLFILVLFSGYIVYDSNQLIKRNQNIDVNDIPGVSTMMALDLFLDFINLFQRILWLIGDRN